MLKVSTYPSKTLRWWYEQSLDNRIDMSPSYQRRGELWSPWKRAHLIDSILNDFDIPKFYVANFFGHQSKLNENRKGFAIIDGKQRLSAIFAFFNDQIPLNSSFILDDQPELKLGKLKYSDLRLRYPAVARKFDDYLPTVMDVVTDEKGKIEELFVRLNSGEPATGAERRNAMDGPVPILVRELSVHPFFLHKVKFNTKRMQEFNLIIKLLMFEFLDGFADTKAKNLDAFAKSALEWQRVNPSDTNPYGPYRDAANRVTEVLELLNGEFKNSDELLSRQGEIPIYYWTARQHPRFVNELRDFVLEFSSELIDNLRRQREAPDTGVGELSSYYAMSRTTNDLNSYEGRFKIFERRFKAFLKSPGRR